MRLWRTLSADTRKSVDCSVTQLMLAAMMPVCTWFITMKYGGSIFWPSVVVAAYFITTAVICISGSFHNESGEYFTAGMFVANLLGVLVPLIGISVVGTLIAINHPDVLALYECYLIIVCDIVLTMLVMAGIIFAIKDTYTQIILWHRSMEQFVTAREQRKQD